MLIPNTNKHLREKCTRKCTVFQYVCEFVALSGRRRAVSCAGKGFCLSFYTRCLRLYTRCQSVDTG